MKDFIFHIATNKNKHKISEKKKKINKKYGKRDKKRERTHLGKRRKKRWSENG